MKDHLIIDRKGSKSLSCIHKIIFASLISIILYDFIFKYKKDNYNFLNIEEINLFINVGYYILCIMNEMNGKDMKRLYQRFFHFCFSISASVPILFFLTYLLNNSENIEFDLTLVNIVLLIGPLALNIMETLIIKRFKPLLLPIYILIFAIILYYLIIHFFGKMGMKIGIFPAERLSEFIFVLKLGICTIIGAGCGWQFYKFLTKPKISKININKSIDSSELSEE
jgi:hypothetical protein